MSLLRAAGKPCLRSAVLPQGGGISALAADRGCRVQPLSLENIWWLVKYFGCWMSVCESLLSSADVLLASQAPALLLCHLAHVLEAALKPITKPSASLSPGLCGWQMFLCWCKQRLNLPKVQAGTEIQLCCPVFSS